MLNIIFDDPNMAYRYGMENFLTQIFYLEKKIPVQISDLTEQNLPAANIIVKRFSAGESTICQPLFQQRNKHSLIIAVYDCRTAPFVTDLPPCITNIIFINRKSSLERIRKRVISGWANHTTGVPDQLPRDCANCKQPKLSAKEASVATLIHAGNDVQDIARKLHMAEKSVSVHKRKIMAKFNLISDSELLSCLRFIKNKIF
ncbi:LuxR C-terminal-related transcriptional regulator [Rahnella bruchi]|uniref:LuxR C-terminal-related transcriptional regulator n=1 Tax=Rahnella bruchi TaxID=1510573 RepID=UPI000EA07A5A|nr:LuxR C-terminal-related transcriptional regulator [Rahnella bruchi]